MDTQVEKWLANTMQDLAQAEHHFDSNSFNDSAFWCRQALEKAIRTLYIHRTGKYPTLRMALPEIAQAVNTPQHIHKLYSLLNPWNEVDYSEVKEDFLGRTRKAVEWVVSETEKKHL